ncbi:MAG TPA: PLP-dependent aminotransferase family protein [Lapillicoccus sp.]|nr:PLP-dependent aminotransferase family protein [Lapillicoccus sp.]
MDLHLSLDPQLPIAQQVFEQIQDAVLGGRLTAGAALPSSRALAESLGVSRNTVTTALDHLIAEGYLEARPGVGTFVSTAVRPRTAPLAVPSALHSRPWWEAESWGIPPSLMRSFDYDFRPGLPDPSSFPFPTWRRLVTRAIRRSAEDGRYADPQGLEALRASIARHLAVSRGLRVGPEHVIVTNGVQQAVSLLSAVLVGPGDVVAVEDPGYPPARRAMESTGARVVGVPVDGEGLVVDRLPSEARFVYVTPAHQFPLGVRMSLRRRLALLDWAGRHDAAVVEDDYDSDFRYRGRPIETLHSLDSSGRVVYVGSFSKTMLPSLRLGYCVAPPGLVGPLTRARFVVDWHGPRLLQAALAEFIDEGRLAAHIRRMRRVYQGRRDRIAVALDRDFSDVLTRIPSVAGLHLAAWTSSEDLDVDRWVRRAAELGVAVSTIQDLAMARTRPGLVFGYGAIPDDVVDAGLRVLRTALL